MGNEMSLGEAPLNLIPEPPAGRYKLSNNYVKHFPFSNFTHQLMIIHIVNKSEILLNNQCYLKIMCRLITKDERGERC